MKIKKRLIVTFEAVGYHCYLNAPAQVDFLQNNHRHLFCFLIEFQVFDDNREKEFFLLQRRMRRYLQDAYPHSEHPEEFQFGGLSCEMLASNMLNRFQADDCVAVEVWEDRENGARIEISE